MFENLLRNLGVPLADAQERNQGAAFLRVAREAYPLSSVVYLALNIPIASEKAERFIHYMYADAWARHALHFDAITEAAAQHTTPWIFLSAGGARTAVMLARLFEEERTARLTSRRGGGR